MHGANAGRASLIALFTVLPLVAGCAKTTSTPIAGGGSEDSSRVEVLYSPPSERKYREIGLVTTQTGQTIVHDRSAQGMITKLQTEAAKMGADAIIVRSVEEGSWGLQGGGHTGFDRGSAQAIAIRYE